MALSKLMLILAANCRLFQALNGSKTIPSVLQGLKETHIPEMQGKTQWIYLMQLPEVPIYFFTTAPWRAKNSPKSVSTADRGRARWYLNSYKLEVNFVDALHQNDALCSVTKQPI